MRLRIGQIEMQLDYIERDVATATAGKLACEVGQIDDVRVVRRSLDARARRREPVFVLTVEVDFTGDRVPDGAQALPDGPSSPDVSPAVHPKRRPVVVGAGPAGLLAALTLAEAGAKPLLIERGAPERERAA